jgi:hypothetical protein
LSLALRANSRKRDSCGARLDVDRRNKAGHLWLPLFLKWLLGVNGIISLIREWCKNSHHRGTELVRTLHSWSSAVDIADEQYRRKHCVGEE